ncbi:MAG: response regulator transcription factor, partial [Verrucomicrobiae bacterium]|nr:response regulator transcription factor [Verrucomicrobiae bacterium]
DVYKRQLYAPRALRAGAAGYLMKSAPTETLIQAIRKVSAGKVVVSEAVQEHLLRMLTVRTQGNALDRLSDRELQVLRLIGQGRTRGQIATELNLSVKTIESHRAHICRKLGLRNSVELLRYAMEFVRHPGTAPPPPAA